MRRFLALVAILCATTLTPAAFAGPTDGSRPTAAGHVAGDDGPGSGGGY